MMGVGSTGLAMGIVNGSSAVTNGSMHVDPVGRILIRQEAPKYSAASYHWWTLSDLIICCLNVLS